MTVWPHVRLEDLCDIQIGRTPTRSEPRYWGPGFPWLSIADMKQGRDLVMTSESITDAAVTERNCRPVAAGTLVLSFKLSLGKVGFIRREMFTNEAIAALPVRDEGQVDTRYLYHALMALDFRGLGERAVKGVTLNTESVGNLLIPLPPLNEQRRIFAVLDKADAVRRKRHQSLTVVHEILPSAFLEMFGDPVGNRRWPLDQFDSVVRSIEPGTSVNGDERPPAPEEWAVLKISAVTSGEYRPDECKVVASVPESPVIPFRGDLLFSRANTRELVAATCIVHRNAPRVFLPDKLWKITPCHDVATSEYLRYLLANPGFRSTLTRHATGTSGSMLNVSQDKLLSLRLPVPPLELQQRFARLVWQIYDLRTKVSEAAAETEKLFDSLAQSCFRADTASSKQL
jgi:type I restriction enzyme, S subunit